MVDEKPRLLRNIQTQSLAVELEKTEAEDLVEEVCKEVGRKWLHVKYFNDRQRLWTDIVERQRERLASIDTAALRLYEFYAR